MIEYSVYLAVFLVTLAGVELYRRWSLRRNLLDIPNERSSHDVPTPRGGGLVFVFVSLVTLGFFSVLTTASIPWQFFAGAGIVAGISLIDDLYGISPFLRLICHGVAAAIVVVEKGGFSEIRVPFAGVSDLGHFGGVVAFIWIVWIINAYNFMDGIDGIAGLQAVIAGLGWFVYGRIENLEAISVLGAVLAASALGFLILNWQPAKIFMGDVGSAFLGYSFAVVPIVGLNPSDTGGDRSWLSAIGMLLLWPFVADSAFTFARRLLRGERVWNAHREHIYQRMVIAGVRHSSVTLFYGVVALGVTGIVMATVFLRLKADMYFVGAAVVAGAIILAFNGPIADRLKERADER